jgi:hypothetical protein
MGNYSPLYFNKLNSVQNVQESASCRNKDAQGTEAGNIKFIALQILKTGKVLLSGSHNRSQLYILFPASGHTT